VTDFNDYGGFGSQPERTEPDFEAEAHWHREEVHDGGKCDCPPGDPWALPAGETYDMESPF
jgi:hypothetical protein